jgi:hypothetical protein
LARREVFTNSLSSGEIAPEYLSRTDMASRAEAAKQLVNVSVLAGGGARRRDGTLDLVDLGADTRLLSTGIGSTAKVLAFQAGLVKFLNLDGTTAQTVSGAPWLVTDLHTMQVAVDVDKIVVTSQNFAPQILTRTAGTWALAAFTFAAGVGGALRQPYYRFPGYSGVTLASSAYTGSVTVVASAALFSAGYVGTRIRYAGIELLITAYTDPTHVTATVQGNLYPTIQATVANSAIFVIGQEVSGLDSNTKGIVSAIPSGTTVQVQLTHGYSYFDWTSTTISEKIVSPTGVTTQGATAPTLVGTPAASLVWDEQLVSPVRGYPGTCGLHRTRLLYGNFPAAGNLVAASALGDITDFDVGTGLDSDAIVELIGRDSDIGVRHFGSTEQLLLFTQAGAQYVPEQIGAPLSPTNFDLLKIGPESAGTPVPILVAEGMLFVEESSGRILGAIPTGNVRRSWQIADLSELAFHLVGTPVELGLIAAQVLSDRKVLVVKADGTLAVMSYRRSDTVSAWMRWQTVGAWRSAVYCAGALYMVAKRTINGSTTYRLEKQDPTAYGDGVTIIPTLATAIPRFANATVSVWSAGSYIGNFACDGSGVLIGVSDTYTSVAVGWDTQVAVELVPPIDSTDGLRHNIRICRVDVEAIGAGPFQVNGYDPSGFVNGTGVGGAVTLQSGVRRFRTLGRSQTATALITQDHAGPLEIRSVTMEVTS